MAASPRGRSLRGRMSASPGRRFASGRCGVLQAAVEEGLAALGLSVPRDCTPSPLTRMHILCALELRRGHDESATTMHHTFPVSGTPAASGECEREREREELEEDEAHEDARTIRKAFLRPATQPDVAYGCIERLRVCAETEAKQTHAPPHMTRHTYDGLMTKHRTWIETKFTCVPFRDTQRSDPPSLSPPMPSRPTS